MQPRRTILLLQGSMDFGGATAVAAWMIEALKKDFEVTVLTATPVNWRRVNHLFGTSINSNEVTVRATPTLLRKLFSLDPDPGSIQPIAYLMRVCHRIRHKFDLVMCASTEEADLGGDGILYVHYPGLARHWISRMDWGNRPLLRQVYLLLRGRLRPWVFMSHYSVERMKRCTILANSYWTAERIRECYGVSAETVYPPVTRASNGLPWQIRENAFIAVGRLNHLKRLDWIVELFDSVRENHADLRLYIVGTRDTTREAEEDYRGLVSLAQARSFWLTIQEGVSRVELLNLLGQVKYAIHAKEDEHFGIAPAEALLAGCIPIVHDSGGQVEIVGGDSRLCFSDRNDALQKIDRLLSHSDLQRSIQSDLDERRKLFGIERFKAEIQRTVRVALKERDI